MTDLQIKSQANEIAEEKNKVELAKLDEARRANQAKEALTDLENLAKYGYTRYAPGTDQGYYTKSGAYGMTNAPFDFWDNNFSKLIGPFASILKGLF